VRRRYPRPEEAKAAVLGFANVVAGVLDFLHEVSSGGDTGEAARRAVRRGRARARALRDAEKAVGRLDVDESDGSG
jgi:hypothetical protein